MSNRSSTTPTTSLAISMTSATSWLACPQRKLKFVNTIGQHSSGEHWECQVMKRQVMDVLLRFDGELKSAWLPGRVVKDDQSA
eukprot:8767522-Pyramimonas_sp.AAC.1